MNQIYALDPTTCLFATGLVLGGVRRVHVLPGDAPLAPRGPVHVLLYWVDGTTCPAVRCRHAPRPTVTNSVLYILPLAVCGHIIMAIFFYLAKRALTCRLLVGLLLLAAFVMMRITGGLRTTSQRSTREWPGAEENEDPADHVGTAPESGGGGTHPRSAAELRAYLNAIEMYMPPLSRTLLDDIYAAAARSARSASDDAQR